MDIDFLERILGVGKSAVESLLVDSPVAVAVAADKIAVDILLVDSLVMVIVDMIVDGQDSLLEDFGNWQLVRVDDIVQMGYSYRSESGDEGMVVDAEIYEKECTWYEDLKSCMSGLKKKKLKLIK